MTSMRPDLTGLTFHGTYARATPTAGTAHTEPVSSTAAPRPPERCFTASTPATRSTTFPRNTLPKSASSPNPPGFTTMQFPTQPRQILLFGLLATIFLPIAAAHTIAIGTVRAWFQTDISATYAAALATNGIAFIACHLEAAIRTPPHVCPASATIETLPNDNPLQLIAFLGLLGSLYAVLTLVLTQHPTPQSLATLGLAHCALFLVILLLPRPPRMPAMSAPPILLAAAAAGFPAVGHAVALPYIPTEFRPETPFLLIALALHGTHFAVLLFLLSRDRAIVHPHSNRSPAGSP